ncbi:uncharacterized protein LOC116254974 isoform X2 [Nymphaea colorata]|uniref:uncharacterized protein LOC116254974 isoform X2 n=1 Tax=Nymphaea colorata TaxID=210225 RepID=UPI00129DF004|nr:uncharacterized protein LOC116254974 isoform X2 [Nymphaea colorata]
MPEITAAAFSRSCCLRRIRRLSPSLAAAASDASVVPLALAAAPAPTFTPEITAASFSRRCCLSHHQHSYSLLLRDCLIPPPVTFHKVYRIE